MVMPTSKALIVDCHKPVCEMIAAILRSAGFMTQTAYTITQALTRVESVKFDLVLADYQTAWTRKRPFAPVLLDKAKEKNSEVRIVIMSGNVSPEDAGDYSFLVKPFTYRELLSKSGAPSLEVSPWSSFAITTGYGKPDLQPKLTSDRISA